MADLLQTLSIAIVLGSLYALIALGYTMVFGVLKLINFAHSDVVALGAWSSIALSVIALPWLGINTANHAPWWAAILVLLLAMFFCGIVGFLIERFAYRPIRSAPRLNALITAIGVSLLLQNIGQLQFKLWSNEKVVATGDVVERKPGQNAGAIRLAQAVTIEPGYDYELTIGKRGDPSTQPADEASPSTAPAVASTSSTKRKLTAPPKSYGAGDELTVDQTIGRTQTVGATFKLVRRSAKPSIVFPFGNKPASIPPGLIPRDSGETVGRDRLDTARDQFAQWLPGSAVLLQLNFFEAAPARPDGSSGGDIYKPVKITTIDAVIVVASIVLMLALQFVIFHTRVGTAMRAVSHNMDTAALMGIPVDRVVSFTFVTGAMLAAAAGFLYSLRYNPINQTADSAWVLLGLKAFVAAVVGGIGNVRGAALGGFLIAFVEQFAAYGSQQIHWDQGSALTDVFVFVLLIVVLLVKPTGLFGSTVREKV
ncbi:MAG: branched-chain amino acid ABC transporter permease [Tepidisphaeraceae bacterium]